MPRTNEGGKRAGARHPPGTRFGRNLPKGFGGATRRPKTFVTDGDPVLQHVIELRALGHPWTYIGQQVGHDERTVKGWCLSHPEMVAAQVRSLTSPDDYMTPMLPKAASRYHDALDQTEDLKLATDVARDVFDRRFGRPTIRQESVSLQGIVINVRSSVEPRTIEVQPQPLLQPPETSPEAG